MFKPYDHPLANKARSSTVCADHLPLGPSPLFRIALISQAHGGVAHASGIFWKGQGGDRLSERMAIDYATFHRTVVYDL